MGPGSRPGRQKLFSRRIAPELCKKLPALFKQRAQGRPGARCTRGLVCDCATRVCTRAYRFSGEHPAFPAQWLYGLWRALPGRAVLVVTVAPRKLSLLWNLTPAYGASQDHTLLPYASAALVRQQHRRPSHPRPTFVTIASAPLVGTGWAWM